MSDMDPGYVLSPRFFASVEFAMRKQRANIEDESAGTGLTNGSRRFAAVCASLRRLLDVKVTDDIPLFARIAAESVFMTDALVDELAKSGPTMKPACVLVPDQWVQANFLQVSTWRACNKPTG
eukprot:s1568_g2.t1